jgi:hypothetical protein
MSITHERQRRLQQLAPAPRQDGELLSAAAFAALTPTGRRDYLGQLTDEDCLAQATVVAAGTGDETWAIVAAWILAYEPRGSAQ